MPALVAGIHDFLSCFKTKTWMAGTSPAMTLSTSRIECCVPSVKNNPDFAALNPGYDCFPLSV
jgi:hypothetical protein